MNGPNEKKNAEVETEDIDEFSDDEELLQDPEFLDMFVNTFSDREDTEEDMILKSFGY